MGSILRGSLLFTSGLALLATMLLSAPAQARFGHRHHGHRHHGHHHHFGHRHHGHHHHFGHHHFGHHHRHFGHRHFSFFRSYYPTYRYYSYGLYPAYRFYSYPAFPVYRYYSVGYSPYGYYPYRYYPFGYYPVRYGAFGVGLRGGVVVGGGFGIGVGGGFGNTNDSSSGAVVGRTKTATYRAGSTQAGSSGRAEETNAKGTATSKIVGDIDYGWTLLAKGEAPRAQTVFAALSTNNPRAGAPKVGYALASAMQGKHSTAVWGLRRAFDADAASLAQLHFAEPLRAHIADLADHYSTAAGKTATEMDGHFMAAALRFLLGDREAAQDAYQLTASAGDRSGSARALAQLLQPKQ